jgi:two-component system, OmpR family, KDP operon response regulator KdpE
MNDIKPNIVVVDDEPQIRKILRITLESNDYKVITAENAEQAIVAAGTSHPNLILLDLGLPDKDGLDVLKELRTWCSVPIIILSVRNSEDDIVAALDLGADDYITKPFNTAELMARIRANLRKTQPTQESIFKNGYLSVDFTSRIVKRYEEEVKLTSTEFSLLVLMIKNIGKVLTHRYILKEIWGPSYVEQTQYLRVFVGQLRKKIEDEDSEVKMIVTESRVGYRMQMLKDNS